VYMGVFVLRYE